MDQCPTPTPDAAVPGNCVQGVAAALRSLVLLAFVVALLASSSPLRAADIHTLYLPVLRAPALSLDGQWQGALTQPGKLFEFRLALAQAGTSLQGTATIREGAYFATMSIAGAVFGNTIVLDEQTIVETNGLPPGIGRWCIKTLTLTPEGSGDQALLAGPWKQDLCNTGRVYLQRPIAPTATVSGQWSGTFTQGSNTYSIEFALNQQQAVIEGVGTTRRDTAFGTMRVRGSVVGRYVLLQETELLASSPSSSWCLKTLETTLASGALRKLEGSWSASGCVPGAISVQQ